MAPEPRVCLGVVAAPHGVKGLLRVKSFTAEPEAIARYGPLEDEAGTKLALELVGAVKGVLVMRIEGVANRDAAERLKGRRLYLPRAALPEPAAEEYYHADLIGLVAELKDGTVLGRVRAVHDFGAGDSLEIAREGAAPVLIPFTRAAVPEVAIKEGRIVVDPPEGLLAPARSDAPARG
ncbi:MAG TPA: ribosome maturation factor RimM [Stellaceae bacterium]|nr:ribosome maturation factor RimM [Stellaceae bacterium]